MIRLIPLCLLAPWMLAQSVKTDGAVLHSGCAADSDVVSAISAGTPVVIRYALAGESVPCYKVAATVAGKELEGYLPASAINGLDAFEKGRQEASWLDTTQMMGAIHASERMPALKAGASAIAGQASDLIQISQPGKALELLEPAIKKQPDATLLALAGVAAWRADDPRRALSYWHSSLALAPNPDLERLVKRVEKEADADKSGEKLYGVRVILRYDPAAMPVETAREVVSTLDEDFTKTSYQLGCSAEERIVAIVQSRDAYRKATDAAEWNGGQYDGRIRVPVAGGQGVDDALRRVLAHETTHACLSMMGRWPAWLQEGLAQKMSGDQLTPALRHKIAEWAKAGKLPKLANLRQDWSRLDTEHAIAAYAVSLAAVELFFDVYKEYGIRNLIRNPEHLAEITADLDRRLGL